MIEKQNKVSKNLFLSFFLLTTPLAAALVSLHNSHNNNKNSVVFLHELEPQRSTGLTALNALTNSGNVIVVFYEDWCPPCKRMTPIFEELAQEMNSIRFVKVKRELYRSLFDYYNLSTVPAILFFRDGILVKVQPSSLTKEALIKLIKQIYNA